MEKSRAIELLKLAVPIKALTQQEYADFVEAVNMGMDALEQPEPKEGHWIPHESPDDGEQYECSECGVLWEFNDGSPEDNEAYYCPKCGAKMKGDSNDR